MVKRLMLLLGMLLAVPALGFLTSHWIISDNDSQLRTLLLSEYPDATPEVLGNATVDRLCSAPDADPETADICSTNDTLHLMRLASVLAAVVGIALLLLIRLGAAIAKNNRMLLLALFKPGLYITALVLTGLVLVHAALLIGSIYYGESALVGRVHVGIIGAIGIGAALGAFAIVRHCFSLFHKAKTVAFGINLDRSQAPGLWATIDETAARLGSLVPDHAVVGLEPNFYVTEADVVCFTGTLTGRTLYCSLSLARIFSKAEFVAVLGHELGHFKGEDTKFSKRFYPIYRGTSNSLQALSAVGEDNAGGLALLPAIVVFNYFLEAFSTAEAGIGRDRELAADKLGASVSSNTAIASALVKLHAYSGIWQALEQAAIEQLREGNYFVNVSTKFSNAVTHYATPEALAFEDLGETHLSHPTDSHPALAARLQSLGLTISDLVDCALDVTPEDAAILLFESPEEHEEDVSVRYQSYLADQLGIVIPDADAGVAAPEPA